MIIVNKLIFLVAAFSLTSCGNGDEQVSGPPRGDTTGTILLSRYTESYPLVDNSGASTYKVLLIGNSHASGLYPVLATLLALGQPDKPVDIQLASGGGFLADRVTDGVTHQDLEREPWTHVILQGQKYSTTGSFSYPTDAAEYWIRGSKQQGATPIMFPEHPREGNTWEGQTLWELHRRIAVRENTCVAPVGMVWDEVGFRAPTLVLHQSDGNHASTTGLVLTALVFYPIITGQPVESLPGLSEFGIDAATEQIMKETVSSVLYSNVPCEFEG
jgi:hypothetical protein